MIYLTIFWLGSLLVSGFGAWKFYLHPLKKKVYDLDREVGEIKSSVTNVEKNITNIERNTNQINSRLDNFISSKHKR